MREEIERWMDGFIARSSNQNKREKRGKIL
jgi:hypothetical protein